MRTGGILLVAAGAVLIYWVLRAGLKSEQSPSQSSSPSGDGSGGKSSGSSGQQDSGHHMAIDTTGAGPTGTIGGVYQIDSTYGNMNDQQKDDANAYAHAIGNVG